MRRVEIAPSPAFEDFPSAATERSIAERFGEQARRRASCDAIRTATRSVTYDELHARSAAVASTVLDALGEGSEPVAVLATDEVARIAALLGILAAGKLFVLLDPAHPHARLTQILEDSGARLVLSDDAAAALGVRSIDVDRATRGNGSVAADVAPEAPACILYTSGSTGRPKGILHSHRNLLFNVLRNTRSLKLCRDDRIALLGSRTMAQATHTTFNALLNGACLHPVDLRSGGFATLARRLREDEVTVYNSSASVFRRFARDVRGRFENLRIVRLGSEPISRADVLAWTRLSPEGSWFVAALSSTETGTIRQVVLDRESEIVSSLVPSGFAVDGAEVEIVDAGGDAAPPGTPGRIAVSSRYLALGYWRRPDLTDAAFRPDPRRPRNRVFLTGDRGRLDEDGCLHHLGRVDDQLKISGNRIEPAEIEATLLEHTDVTQAVLVARENAAGEPRLVAHVAAVDGTSAHELRAFLRARLPAPMIPSGIVVQRELPQTPAGKADRSALPPWPAPRANVPAEEPQDLLHSALTRIWEDVLGVHPVGLREDFFELGGDSLMAVELLGRIEEACCRALPGSVLGRGATVENVAAAIAGEATADRIVEIQRGVTGRPFFYHSGDMTGAAFYCRRLAHEIGPDVPFYAIPSHGADGRPVPHTIDEMVSDRLPGLLAIQPRGPYRLGGYCHGGVFAYEMARRLVAMGHRVDALVLVEATYRAPYARALRRLDRAVAAFPDPLPGTVRRAKALLRRVRRRVDDAREMRDQGRAAQLRFLTEDLASGLVRRLRPAPRRHDRLWSLYRDYQAVLESYVPGAYEGRVVVLRAADGRAGDGTVPLAGWGPFADRVDVVTVPGDHHSCVTAHASALAAVLRRFLDGSLSEPAGSS